MTFSLTILCTQLIDLLIILSSLFNSIFSHGCVLPISFLSSTIIPIPKNPRLDLKNSENYRAIALSSVFCKIFDTIVIEKQVEQLGTSELQFGYKPNSSTVMCSTALTETIEYYVSRKISSICFINRCLEGF